MTKRTSEKISELNNKVNSEIESFSDKNNISLLEVLVNYNKLYLKFDNKEIKKQYRLYCLKNNYDTKKYDRLILFYNQISQTAKINNAKIVSHRTINFIENYYNRYNKLPVV